ncbi:hypothetical protein, partial [Kitasatospora sp. NPDC097691]|uniref:hypothetical protein n=1 Tax=Kitasatospora sp. NPDC097691 TaxID=3157231 RepID=UPI00332AB579
AHPEPVGLGTVFDWVAGYGYPLRKVSYGDWLSALQESAAHSWDNALFPFLPLFAAPGDGAAPGSAPGGLGAAVPGSARSAYRESGTDCPPIDERLLHTYLTELVRSGYLQDPRPAPDDTPLENA